LRKFPWRKGLVATAGLVAVGVYLVWPQSEYALDDLCEPKGAVAQARSWTQGSRFWAGQQKFAAIRLEKLRSEPLIFAALNEQVKVALVSTTIRDARIDLEASLRGHGEPLGTPSAVALRKRAEQLRDMADDLDGAATQLVMEAQRLADTQSTEICLEDAKRNGK
jgi:hypothetical protein